MRYYNIFGCWTENVPSTPKNYLEIQLVIYWSFNLGGYVKMPSVFLITAFCVANNRYLIIEILLYMT